jgi:dipeptidyl aminopeptidase/acylaminoacyl peptidase
VAVPGFDFTGVLVEEAAPGQDPLLGVQVLTDAPGTVWLHPAMAAVQQAVDERLPGRSNLLTCRRCREDDRTVLVESSADRHPGELWLWRGSASAPSTWRRIGVVRPGINPQQMAEMAFTRYAARDGRGIPLWVTLPAAAPPAATASVPDATATAPAPAPAVLLVHGGPWVRGSHWGWHPLPQFLASRGYVVIEPEFRGSTGYGHAHFEAGIRQWGLAMQDDVADALQWAVAMGLVDGRRVCIAGASYGGYATLMGLVRHPGLYRCGAAWVAVTDPRLMYRWTARTDQGDEVRQFDLPRLIGDPVQHAAQLEATSPLVQAARIKAPVLLAAGGQDRRVPLEHGTRMRDALKAAGNEPEWIVYADEGHGWQTLKTRVDFAQRLEAFLARHLAPR